MLRRDGTRIGAVVGLAALAVIAVALSAAAIVHKPDPPRSGVTIDDVPTPVADHPTASLWIGDSYTAGAGATNPARAESCLTAQSLGWICMTDAEGGTGWVADGHEDDPAHRSVTERIRDDLGDYLPDVVVFDLGRNDSDTPEVARAARAIVKQVHAQWRPADLVFIAPYFMDSTSELRPGLAATYRDLAKQYGGTFVDPIADGWINSASARMVIADGVHPSPEGHQYLAAHLSGTLRRAGVGPHQP